MFESLDDGNFLLYAAKHYDNPQCFDDVEFFEDLCRFKYIKKLMNKYRESGELKERLILNHIIVICNLFGPQAAVRMLFLKLQGYETTLKPFLIFLNVMPDRVPNVAGKTIISSEISMDPTIIDKLRQI